MKLDETELANAMVMAFLIEAAKGDDAELHIAERVAYHDRQGDQRSSRFWTAVAYKLADILEARCGKTN